MLCVISPRLIGDMYDVMKQTDNDSYKKAVHHFMDSPLLVARNNIQNTLIEEYIKIV